MPKYSAEDREFEKQFKKSLSVSSYKDQIIDKIYGGKDIDSSIVPNYADGNALVGENETKSLFSVFDDENIIKTANSLNSASVILDPPISHLAEQMQLPESLPQPVSQKPQFKLSQNQFHAVQKYPALIEFLGTDKAESLVNEIAAKVNQYMIERIGYNSQEICPKYAKTCVADRQNIKQFFVGENEEWACVVTASGPFRGDEAILYDKDVDKSHVLRKVKDDYQNITEQFNVIHEFATQAS